MQHRLIITLAILAAIFPLSAQAQRLSRQDKIAFLEKMWGYPQTIDTANAEPIRRYAYRTFIYKTERRNAFLMAVPTLFAVAHSGKRAFAGEIYDEVDYYSPKHFEARNLLTITTIPHDKKALPNLLKYSTLDIYGCTMAGDNLLSPFYRRNRIFYKYNVYILSPNVARVTFRPRTNNTQAVRGEARVDRQTGQLIEIFFHGEFDMIDFNVDITMGREGRESLVADKVDLDSKFTFVGNRVTMSLKGLYNLPGVNLDTIQSIDDANAMRLVRPIQMRPEQQRLLSEYLQEKATRDSLRAEKAKLPKKLKAKDILWDMIGENLLTRVRGNYGGDRGYFRLNPLINPLSLGYSGRKGLTYKFDFRTGYQLSPHRTLGLRIKAAYSFRLKEFFYDIPLAYRFSRKHDGYIKFEAMNGNRITDNDLAKKVKNIKGDSIRWDQMDLEYFRDHQYSLTCHYDINPYIGLEGGIIFHRRKAVHPWVFDDTDLPTEYRAVAPQIEVAVRPWGYNGAVFTLDYEYAIKGFMKGNMEYRRWEMDASYQLHLDRMQSWAFRLGSGFYTSRGDRKYFLDYTNFRQDNIIGGWDDDWSGHFELLNSHWYNASEYYVRTNTSFETPFLALTWVPFIGHFIERERIYFSTLLVRHLHPYTELGYGCTTRFLSFGIFGAFHNAKFDGLGCKVNIEIFRNW